MKKIFLSFLPLLLFSCIDHPRTDYEIHITYTLHGNNTSEKWEYTVEYVDTLKMSGYSFPIYSLNEKGTILTIQPNNDKWGQWMTIYQGPTPATVNSFSYKTIRKYKE